MGGWGSEEGGDGKEEGRAGGRTVRCLSPPSAGLSVSGGGYWCKVIFYEYEFTKRSVFTRLFFVGVSTIDRLLYTFDFHIASVVIRMILPLLLLLLLLFSGYLTCCCLYVLRSQLNMAHTTPLTPLLPPVQRGQFN